jgi:hypothetical protein
VTRPEQVLRLFLRIYGCVTGLAVVAVFMPRAWMAACHAWLGLGPFPEGPIVEYLARSLSAFYAMTGGLMWLASFGVRRHAGLIAYLGIAGVLFAPVLFAIDLHAGMPVFWTFWEGSVVLASSLAILVLLARVRRQAVE